MKKVGLVILCFIFLCSAMCLTACKKRPKQQTIKYQRKLEKYLPAENTSQKKSTGSSIDLSEGPKLKYEANFGPREVNFDVKVVNPYNF